VRPPPSSPDAPWPVRTVARLVGEWVSRLGTVWVEGQITGLSRRPGANRAFFTLRDTAAEVSLSLVAPAALLADAVPPLADGQRVVVHARPEFYLGRGQLQLTVLEVRPVGQGALLERLERLKALLTHEGLFDVARKKPLPFLPRAVGLITGRESAAMRDVVENATRRWPGVQFEIREVVVQGPSAVTAVCTALRELDRVPHVDVVVIARGGGSLEDLLPFSDEALCREVAACRTPVVSAIGHEQDMPLLDLVADYRASTPTDAAKRVVPDVAEERERVLRLRRSAWRSLTGRLQAEEARVAAMRSRPCLADPTSGVVRRHDEVAALRARSMQIVRSCLEQGRRDIVASLAQVRALSPAATLERGYAVVQSTDGVVVRSASAVVAGEALRVRVAAGELDVRVENVRVEDERGQAVASSSATESGPEI
jgi:exodeoxyribonuclease VII large subunit